MKRELLGIDAALIEQHTSVSEEAARIGRQRATQYGFHLRAFDFWREAGPVSATGAIPGTVFIGFAGPDGLPEARRIHLPGDRNRVRMLAAQTALDQLRKKLPG